MGRRIRPAAARVLATCAIAAAIGCAGSAAPDDAPPSYVPMHACTSDDHCTGANRCVEGACECATNAECNPFGTSEGACHAGRCVAACPFSDAPRERAEWAAGCGDPREATCCGAGERCCPAGFEDTHCLPGDRPCWPSCPGAFQRACAPGAFCPGAEVATGLAPRCSELSALATGIDTRSGCLAECPPERRCGAQSCCALGTVCRLGGVGPAGPISPDGDPGPGVDLQWVATPAGLCCIPD